MTAIYNNHLNIAPNINYYNSGIYWNDFEMVREYINKKISGDSEIDWQRYIKEQYGIFDTGFFPCCGNGWVERSLFNHNLIKRVVGVDVARDLLFEAESRAADVGLPCEYLEADINTFIQPHNKYDLVVNYAALNHVAYINNVSYQISKMLKPEGLYVAFDYIGVHRNQYSWPAWSRMLEINTSLPPRYQVKLVYPNIKTMLNVDPTEAIHSELQKDVLNRYFDIVQFNPLGGSIAYQLLYQNKRLYEERNTSEGRCVVDMILLEDQMMLDHDSDSSLFAFWIAIPKRSNYPVDEKVLQWREDEEKREEMAKVNGGRYYPLSPLEIIYNEISDLRYLLEINKIKS